MTACSPLSQESELRRNNSLARHTRREECTRLCLQRGRGTPEEADETAMYGGSNRAVR